jgi:phage terminase small subunit
MKDPDGLTNRQRLFANAILGGKSATRAAETAGYSPKSAAVTGWRMLRNAKIAALIATRQRAAAERAELSCELVLRRLLEIQAGERDGQALRALELLGKHLGMFPDRVAMADPATMSDDELAARRQALRRKLGLPA